MVGQEVLVGPQLSTDAIENSEPKSLVGPDTKVSLPLCAGEVLGRGKRKFDLSDASPD